MILTHSQLALENSLRRILPPGVVSCWIPDGYGKAKDVIGGNHGTCFGTHPNVRIISGFPIDQINACDALTGWATANGVLSIDTSDKKEGTGSLKDTVASPNIGGYYNSHYTPIGSRDWTIKEDLLFWFYCDRASTAFSIAYFTVRDTLNNWAWWYMTFSAGEWTAMKQLLLATPDGSSGTPVDLSLINRITFSLRAADTTPFYKKIDDIRVTGRRSLINPSVGWYFGGDDSVKIPQNASLRFSGNFSAGAWAKVIPYTKYGKIIRSYALNPDFYIMQTTDAPGEAGSIVCRDDNGNGGSRPVPGAFDNSWHRIVGVIDGTYLKAYKDGQFLSEIDAGFDTGFTFTDWYLGSHAGVTQFIKGYEALPFVVKGALSPAQVKNDWLNTRSLFAPRG